jgi:hypothetical protein
MALQEEAGVGNGLAGVNVAFMAYFQGGVALMFLVSGSGLRVC